VRRLAPGGLLLCPVKRSGRQHFVEVRQGSSRVEEICEASFVPLVQL